MTEQQYRSAEGISKSSLDWIAPPRTPAHYAAHRAGLVKTDETAAMRFGSLTHRFVLEPDTVADFVVRPEGLDFRSKDGKAWRDSVGDRQVITQEENDALVAMRDSVWSHPFASRLLKGAKTEQSLFATDGNGMLRKGRLDALPGGSAVVDLKTTFSADAKEFERSIAKYRYHVQAAYYLSLCSLLGMDEKRDFVFVVVEKTAPFACAVYTLDDQAIGLGRLEYQRDLELIAKCEASGAWPGFSQECLTVGLPKWAVINSEESL